MRRSRTQAAVYVFARYRRYFFFRFLRRIFFFFHFHRWRACVFLKRLESFEVVAIRFHSFSVTKHWAKGIITFILSHAECFAQHFSRQNVFWVDFDEVVGQQRGRLA